MIQQLTKSLTNWNYGDVVKTPIVVQRPSKYFPRVNSSTRGAMATAANLVASLLDECCSCFCEGCFVAVGFVAAVVQGGDLHVE
jgi:hypothetical protein